MVLNYNILQTIILGLIQDVLLTILGLTQDVLLTIVCVIAAGSKTEELPYLTMMNASLPNDIRVLAWAPVDLDFSAR